MWLACCMVGNCSNSQVRVEPAKQHHRRMAAARRQERSGTTFARRQPELQAHQQHQRETRTFNRPYVCPSNFGSLISGLFVLWNTTCLTFYSFGLKNHGLINRFGLAWIRNGILRDPASISRVKVVSFYLYYNQDIKPTHRWRLINGTLKTKRPPPLQ